MTLPNRAPEPAILPAELDEALQAKPIEVHKSRDYLLVYDRQSDVESFEVDRSLFDRINLGTGGVIVTAPGDTVDFVSRFFTPQATILEDPVTGSAHCTSAPYWAGRLGKPCLKPNNFRSAAATCIVKCCQNMFSSRVRPYCTRNPRCFSTISELGRPYLWHHGGLSQWLQTIGVAGFMFFLLKGIGWLVVFWLISRGIIRKHTVAKLKLRWRNLWRANR